MDPAVPPEHMALLPDGEQPRARSRGRLAPGCRQTVVILLALIVLVLPLALYERENNLPNPFWGLLNGTYTYTPDKGPPGADLLNSRPDEALLAYINDYLKVARTYPCTENIQQWRGLDISDDDPVEAGHGCTVVRPVERIAIVSVRIDRLGILKGPAAFVTYSIMYVSGEKRQDTATLIPRKYQDYALAYIHEDCWSNLAFLQFYPSVVSHVPPHVAYDPVGAFTPTCNS